MNAPATLFGPRMRSTSPSWAKLFIEILDNDCGSIDVQWLQADETIVLETEPEPC